MPDDLTKEEIEAHAGDDMRLVYALMTTWESLGVLVFRGEVSLSLVDDFFNHFMAETKALRVGRAEGAKPGYHRGVVRVAE